MIACLFVCVVCVSSSSCAGGVASVCRRLHRWRGAGGVASTTADGSCVGSHVTRQPPPALAQVKATAATALIALAAAASSVLLFLL